MSGEGLAFRRYAAADHDRVLAICVAAFAPIHAGFEAALGPALFAAEFGDWRTGYARTLAELGGGDGLYVAEASGEIAGFVHVAVDAARGMGEIGLNAVDPPRQRRGIGRAMYRFALAELARRGARFATVGTGGDAAHAPARAAYAAVGFDRAIPSVHYFRAL
jgi:ribosomal protein S18 acetylase RimI-like enzyme